MELKTIKMGIYQVRYIYIYYLYFDFSRSTVQRRCS